MLSPSTKALAPFISVGNMMRLIHHIGLEPMLVGLANTIEADFKRWPIFDKTPRIASHSTEGVIELMPPQTATPMDLNMSMATPVTPAKGYRRSPPLGYWQTSKPDIHCC